MALKDESKDYMDLPDEDAEKAAITAFLKLTPLDQVKLMFWLVKRDTSLCEKQIFIEFCKNPEVAKLGV